jgi:hypothetical protein
MKLNEYLKEVQEVQIKIGDDFTLRGDIGIFKKGDIVTVTNKKLVGNDIELTLSNDKGKEDKFYLDKNDDFEELG